MNFFFLIRTLDTFKCIVILLLFFIINPESNIKLSTLSINSHKLQLYKANGQIKGIRFNENSFIRSNDKTLTSIE